MLKDRSFLNLISGTACVVVHFHELTSLAVSCCHWKGCRGIPAFPPCSTMSDWVKSRKYVSWLPRPVLLKLEQVLESYGGLVKTQLDRPHSRMSDSVGSGWAWKSAFLTVSRGCWWYYSRDYTWTTDLWSTDCFPMPELYQQYKRASYLIDVLKETAKKDQY